jgi:hypothetical protein
MVRSGARPASACRLSSSRDSARVSPVLSATRASSVLPACETNPAPSALTSPVKTRPSRVTFKVNLQARDQDLRQAQESLLCVTNAEGDEYVGDLSRGGAVREMEDRRPSSVGPAGAGAKPPCAALAEDRRGERQGNGAALIASGGDQEDVPEALGRLAGRRCRSVVNSQVGIETGASSRCPGISLAAARVVGQAVPGVETA